MACNRLCQQIKGALGGATTSQTVNNTLFGNAIDPNASILNAGVCLPTSGGGRGGGTGGAGGAGGAGGELTNPTGNVTLINGKPDTSHNEPRSGFDFLSIFKARRFGQSSVQASVERPDVMLPGSLQKKLRLRPAGT